MTTLLQNVLPRNNCLAGKAQVNRNQCAGTHKAETPPHHPSLD